MSERQEKVSEELRTVIGRYIASESNRTSLITVTRIQLSPDLKYATIFVTVFPTEKEKPALAFLKRNLGDLRTYVAKESRIARVPSLSVTLDQGERNRQRLDRLVEEDSEK